MLSNLLERLRVILENYKIRLNETQMTNLAVALDFHNGGIIPAKIIKRELNISYEETHKLMTFLSTKGILKPKYRVYCENDVITGASKIYNDPAEIPIDVCDRCEKECILIKNLLVEFEVCI